MTPILKLFELYFFPHGIESTMAFFHKDNSVDLSFHDNTNDQLFLNTQVICQIYFKKGICSN